MGTGACSLEVNSMEREANHSEFGVEVKNACGLTSTYHICLHGVVHREFLPILLLM